ncbi:hypothetical protein B0H12DRAFT_1268656 [Mycena haematopus]|nr:hypothetical protein B0H12DRAFT_1268656 [Mycena haematopus]
MFSLWSFFTPHASTPPPADMRCIPCTGFDVAARDFILTTASSTRDWTLKHWNRPSKRSSRAGFRGREPDLLSETGPLHVRFKPRPIAFTAEDFTEPYRSAARPEIPTNLGTLPLTRSERGLYSMRGRLLGGEDINAIPGMEWDMAPFDIFNGPTTTTHPRGWFKLGLLGQFFFILWFLLRIVRDPKEEARLIRVPKSFLEEFKTEIMENLKLQGSTEWVGSSDVLLAWWFKTLYSLRSIRDATPIHIHLPINLRDTPIFAGDSKIVTPYINNAVSAIPIPPIPAMAFHTESLDEIALRIRRAILAYNADLAGIKADVQWRCANPLMELFPCPPRGEYTFQTNWRSARLSELDFSGARPQEPLPGEQDGINTRVVLAVGYVLSSKNIPMRGAGGVFMEDEDAVWMFQIRGTKDWESVCRRDCGATERLNTASCRVDSLQLNHYPQTKPHLQLFHLYTTFIMPIFGSSSNDNKLEKHNHGTTGLDGTGYGAGAGAGAGTGAGMGRTHETYPAAGAGTGGVGMGDGMGDPNMGNPNMVNPGIGGGRHHVPGAGTHAGMHNDGMMADQQYGAGAGAGAGAGTGVGTGAGVGGVGIPPTQNISHQNQSSGGGAMTGKIEHAVGSIVGSKSLKAKGIQKEQAFREARGLKIQSQELAEAERLERESGMRRERAVAHGAHPDNRHVGGLGGAAATGGPGAYD